MDESERPEQTAILEMDEPKVERHKKEMLLLAEDKMHDIVKDWAEGLGRRPVKQVLLLEVTAHNGIRESIHRWLQEI